MRPLILLVFLLSACAAYPHALTYVQASAPMWTINPSMWNSENAIVQAPTLPANTGPQSVAQ